MTKIIVLVDYEYELNNKFNIFKSLLGDKVVKSEENGYSKKLITDTHEISFICYDGYSNRGHRCHHVLNLTSKKNDMELNTVIRNMEVLKLSEDNETATVQGNDMSKATLFFAADGSMTIKGYCGEVNTKTCLSRHEKDLILNGHAILKNANEEYKKAIEEENKMIEFLGEQQTKLKEQNEKIQSLIDNEQDYETIIESNDRVIESVLEFVYEKGLHNELLDTLHNKKNESPESFNERDYEFVSEMFLDMYRENAMKYEGIADAFGSSQKIEQIKDYLKKCVPSVINQSKISNPTSKEKETIQELLKFLDEVQLWMESE